MLKRFLTYLWNIVKVFDVCGNVFILGALVVFVKCSVTAVGSIHYTMSEAFDEMRAAKARGEPVWLYKESCITCKILTAVFKFVNKVGVFLKIAKPLPANYDHCTDSMTNPDGTPIQSDISSA